MDNPYFFKKNPFVIREKQGLKAVDNPFFLRWTSSWILCGQVDKIYTILHTWKVESRTKKKEKSEKTGLSTRIIHNGDNVVNNRCKTVDISFFVCYNIDIMKRTIDEIYQNEILVEKKELLEKFRLLLLEYNQKYNLTAILEEKDVYYKHFLDSAAGVDLFSKGARVAEIGSGAGFPSMVLKILRPDLSFDLFESVGKKCEFLHAVVDNFGFTGVNVYNVRAEDAAKDSKFREKYDFVTARAVARMNTLSEYCLPFVKVGGKFVAYKSGDKTEIEEAKSAYATLGGKLKEVYEYSLPEEYGDRVLAVVEKVKATPTRYPRGQGKERKNPL